MVSGVIDKSAAILEALAEGGPATLADLVDATGLSRPTAHRLAVALEAHGLVGRDERGRFRLGVRLAAWGRQADAIPAALLEQSAAVLAALRDETGESAQLYVRDGDHRVCVAAAERPSGLRDTVPVGARLPLVAGSGARCCSRGPNRTDWPVGADGGRVAGGAPAGLGGIGGRAGGRGRQRQRAGPGPSRGRWSPALCVSGPIDRLGRRPGPRFGPTLVAAAATLEARLA